MSVRTQECSCAVLYVATRMCLPYLSPDRFYIRDDATMYSRDTRKRGLWLAQYAILEFLRLLNVQCMNHEILCASRLIEERPVKIVDKTSAAPIFRAKYEGQFGQTGARRIRPTSDWHAKTPFSPT